MLYGAVCKFVCAVMVLFCLFSSQGCFCSMKSGCNCQGIKGQKVIEHANIHKHTYSHVHRQMTMSCHKHIALRLPLSLQCVQHISRASVKISRVPQVQHSGTFRFRADVNAAPFWWTFLVQKLSYLPHYSGMSSDLFVKCFSQHTFFFKAARKSLC